MSLLAQNTGTMSADDSSAPPGPLLYLHYAIARLVPGPMRARFTGVVVNIYSYKVTSSAPNAAKGCLRLLLRDHGSEILVKLWFADTSYDDIVLGTRLTVAVTHVSSAVQPGMSFDALKSLPANLTVSVFPERDAGCAVWSNEDGEGSQNVSEHARNPATTDHTANVNEVCLEQRRDNPRQTPELGVNMNGLIDLEAFVNGATADRSPGEVKLLMAVLKVGQVKQVTKRDGTSFETISLTVVDYSCLSTGLRDFKTESRISALSDVHLDVRQQSFALKQRGRTVQYCELSLSTSLTRSCQRFRLPTVIVLTYPKLNSQAKRRIRPTSCSQFCLDPFGFAEARILRHWAQRLLFDDPIVREVMDDLVQDIEKNQVFSHSNFEATIRGKRLSLGPNTFDMGSHRTAELCADEQCQPVKTQYTLPLFIAQTQLQPARPFKAYLSVIVIQMHLVALWEAGKIFVGACDDKSCPGRMFGTSAMSMACNLCCRSVQDAKWSDPEGQSCFNPQLLGGIADEEAGFYTGIEPPAVHSNNLQDEKKALGHNLLVTDQAVYGLTGLQRSNFEAKFMGVESGDDRRHHLDTSPTDHDIFKARLQGIEDALLWTRLTLVVGWTGDMGGGLNEGKIVVLEVIS